MKNVHIPVLLNEAIDGLDFQDGDIFLDATLGGGGHSAEVAKRFGEKVEIIGIDLDPKAIQRAKEAIGKYSQRFTLKEGNFRKLDEILDQLGQPKVNKILYDLGWSSNQLESSGRGFSFQKNEPLLMTFGEEKQDVLTAKKIVNEWQEENIADILYGYGGERFSRRIAKAIVQSRKKEMIDNTYQLVEIIRKTAPAWYRQSRLHFATKSFQALRIAVNDELEALKEGLNKGFERLAPEGRMAVISFHSLEDRAVKQFFKSKMDEADIIGRRFIRPPALEIQANPRARSAKLRLIGKVNENARIKVK